MAIVVCLNYLLFFNCDTFGFPDILEYLAPPKTQTPTPPAATHSGNQQQPRPKTPANPNPALGRVLKHADRPSPAHWDFGLLQTLPCTPAHITFKVPTTLPTNKQQQRRNSRNPNYLDYNPNPKTLTCMRRNRRKPRNPNYTPNPKNQKPGPA